LAQLATMTAENVLALEMADPGVAIVRLLAIELTAQGLAGHQRPHRGGCLGATQIVMLERPDR
jgi:hypothetical protein